MPDVNGQVIRRTADNVTIVVVADHLHGGAAGAVAYAGGGQPARDRDPAAGASVMPTHVSGNPNLTCLVIGERAAEWFKAA